jgi:hypothetical protein
MGVGLYVVFERPVEGYGPEDFDGKAAARALEQLGALTVSHKLKSLQEFLSFNVQELTAFANGEGLDTSELTCPPEQWFDPSDALTTVRGILSELERRDSSTPSPTAVENDLKQIERALQAADKQRIRFHLTLDVP